MKEDFALLDHAAADLKERGYTVCYYINSRDYKEIVTGKECRISIHLEAELKIIPPPVC